jgi:hypothetical protein
MIFGHLYPPGVTGADIERHYGGTTLVPQLTIRIPQDQVDLLDIYTLAEIFGRPQIDCRRRWVFRDEPEIFIEDEGDAFDLVEKHLRPGLEHDLGEKFASLIFDYCATVEVHRL